MIGNYNAICCIDTDDGSAYINVHHNVLAYSLSGLKSDFGGQSEVYHNNLMPYTYDTMFKDFRHTLTMFLYVNDGFYNNTVMYIASYGSDCFTNGLHPPPAGMGAGWEVHDNHVYSESGETFVCNGTVTLADWQAAGHDQGTTSDKWPADELLITWAKQLLIY